MKVTDDIDWEIMASAPDLELGDLLSQVIDSDAAGCNFDFLPTVMGRALTIYRRLPPGLAPPSDLTEVDYFAGCLYIALVENGRNPLDDTD